MNKYCLVLIISGIFLLNSCKDTKTENSDLNFEASIKAGGEIYNSFCIGCHLDDGKGVVKVFPPLANSDYLERNQLEAIKGIKYGMRKEITVNGINYNGNMAAQGLSDQEIANVMNYINNAWGNSFGTFITAKEVSKLAP